MATTDEFPYVELVGEKIKLKPINVAEDIEELYKNSHGDATLESLWEYLPYGPFTSLEAMRAKYQKDLIPASRLYVVIDLATDQKIGLMQFINISPEHKRVEIGALGLGFSFEGVFRQHMLLKGKNRDSAWFSVIESEWETVKMKLLGRLEKYNQSVE